jgi:hypothetical protein
MGFQTSILRKYIVEPLLHQIYQTTHKLTKSTSHLIPFDLFASFIFSISYYPSFVQPVHQSSIFDFNLAKSVLSYTIKISLLLFYPPYYLLSPSFLSVPFTNVNHLHLLLKFITYLF